MSTHTYYPETESMDQIKKSGVSGETDSGVQEIIHWLAQLVVQTPRLADLPENEQNIDEVLFRRYREIEDNKDRNAALQHYMATIQHIPNDHPMKPRCLMGMASCFIDQFMESEDLQDIAAALENDQAALNLTPEDHPERSLYLRNIDFDPLQCFMAYSEAFRWLPEILWKGHDVPVRHAALKRLHVQQATSWAFKACTNLSKVTSAVEIMEQGMATIFQQTQQLKREVDELHPDQAETFQKLSFNLYSRSSTDTLDIMNNMNQYNDLLAEIRQQPGHEHFLHPKPYTILRQAAQGGPIVILNSHKDGCDGIIIPDPISEPIHFPIPDIDISMLELHQAALKDVLNHRNGRFRAEFAANRLGGQREHFTLETTEEAFAGLLARLWVDIVSPVYQVLESHGIHGGRLWWLLSGSFIGLPLHAACSNDPFIHSYTATLGSLLDAYARQSSSTEHNIGIVGVTQTTVLGHHFLPGVKLEVEKISSIVSKPQVLLGEQATPDAVKKQLQDCSWLHLACHGNQDLEEPTKSHLVLYGGTLQLDTILRMPLLNSEFVFLAACQTAMGDRKIMNESFHLGGGFIAAGFRSAIGTLWTMNDQDGPLVAEIVYSHLFRHGQHPQASDAAEALDLAVKELRKRQTSYERWVPFIHMGI